MYRKADTSQNSFLPMAIGNIWKMGEQNYTKIQDTLRIGGKLYFKFYSLVGGDAVDVKYLRIDNNNQLLEAYLDQTEKIYTHARFNALPGEAFYTLGDKTENDYKVTVVEKTEKKMTFEFEMVYHQNLKGSKHRVSYIKGLGYEGPWKEVIINGELVKDE